MNAYEEAVLACVIYIETHVVDPDFIFIFRKNEEEEIKIKIFFLEIRKHDERYMNKKIKENTCQCIQIDPIYNNTMDYFIQSKHKFILCCENLNIKNEINDCFDKNYSQVKEICCKQFYKLKNEYYFLERLKNIIKMNIKIEKYKQGYKIGNHLGISKFKAETIQKKVFDMFVENEKIFNKGCVLYETIKKKYKEKKRTYYN